MRSNNSLCCANKIGLIIFGGCLILYTAFTIGLFYATFTRETPTTAITGTNVTIMTELCNTLLNNQKPYTCLRGDHSTICFGVTVPITYTDNGTDYHDSLTKYFCNRQNADDYAGFYQNQTRRLPIHYHKFNPKEWHMVSVDKWLLLMILGSIFSTILTLGLCVGFWIDFYYSCYHGPSTTLHELNNQDRDNEWGQDFDYGNYNRRYDTKQIKSTKKPKKKRSQGLSSSN